MRDANEIYDFLSFDPEKVNSFELGYKGQLFDRAVTIAAAAFRADYTDIQIPGSVGAVVGGIPTFIGITTNAAKARIQGLEFESTMRARDALVAGGNLSLNVALGYLDAKFRRYIDARGIDVSSRRKIQNTPKWTLSETLAYSLPFGDGRLEASGTASYRSASQQFELRTPVPRPAGLHPVRRQSGV